MKSDVQNFALRETGMKRAAVILGILSLGIMSVTVWAGAQNSAPQTPPAAGQAAPAAGATTGTAAPAAGAATAPAAKRPPQTKTQPEFDAWKAAAASPDPATMEKAADDFATKFPDSEVRVLLYKNTMRLYQNANNADKAEAMGRKVLSFDPDDPEALVTVAEVVAEKTRDTDIDKDQRYAEAISMAQKATQTVNTDIQVPAGTPQEKIDAYKGLLLSQAYSIIGTIEFKKENYAAAEADLQKSIDAYPIDPDKVVILRLALALDKQQKYPEALKVANRAVELTQKEETSVVGSAARRERDRLQQLTGSAAPAPTAAPAPAPQPQAPPKN
jgi:tetratricopeptide (TPR) repeat protein